MSDPAHVVIKFGNSHIEFYRHNGGSLCKLGPLLVSAIEEAMSAAHANSFQRHPGGRIIRTLLTNKTELMSLMESSEKLLGVVKDDFQFSMGTIGEDWRSGYLLEFYPFEDETPIVENKGRWVITYHSDLEGFETLEEWLPNGEKYSVDEFKALINNECVPQAANEELEG